MVIIGEFDELIEFFRDELAQSEKDTLNDTVDSTREGILGQHNIVITFTHRVDRQP